MFRTLSVKLDREDINPQNVFVLITPNLHCKVSVEVMF
jgi:hypothetical protein